MYFGIDAGIFFGAFIVWGFVMAFVFNLLMRGVGAKKDTALLLVSAIMAISYFTSDHFFNYFSKPDIYLTWTLYDFITLICVLLVYWFFRHRSSSTGVVYIVCGLVFNSLMVFSMYIDIMVHNNREPWWLWSLYSLGTGICEYLMVVSLIVDRDFLGIRHLARKLFSRSKKQGFDLTAQKNQ